MYKKVWYNIKKMKKCGGGGGGGGAIFEPKTRSMYLKKKKKVKKNKIDRAGIRTHDLYKLIKVSSLYL